MQSTSAHQTTAFDSASSSVQAPEDHDIVIVGGGLVGLALANALCMSDRTQKGYGVVRVIG
jgi:NADH dehydrogenase FAD-containing subunit